MPLFDFINGSGEEFAFGDGMYSLRRFNPSTDLPTEHMPGLSQMDLDYIKRELWAIVANDPDLGKYSEDVNRLLTSFKIYTLGRLFIKYRLCADNPSLCRIINEKMSYILGEKSRREVTLEQLHQVNVGFERLQEMDSITSASNRTHNAIYFMYGAYFASGHAWYLFVLLFAVLEALFSEDRGGGATRTICQRASAFLGSRPRCTYADIERLYNIRSELVHGRRKAAASGQDLADAHELEFLVSECMKKMLDERIYLKYSDPKMKEAFFDGLTSTC
jgi:hypothetical protein